jgi:hypothetical protein
MDYQTEAGKLGQTINVGSVPSMSAGSVTAANVAPTYTDMIIGSKTITLDQQKGVRWGFTEADWRDNDLTSTAKQAVRSATAAIVDSVNEALYAQYYKIPYAVGTAGTGFFASNIDGLADADKMLTTNKCPLEMRKGVFSLKDYAALLKLSEVQNANTYGGTEVMRRGVLQDVLGFMIMRDQQAPTHTAGTITGNPTMGAAATTVATSTITADSDDAVALKQGDIIEVDSKQYAVQADLTIAASNTGTLTVDRNWETALDGDETLAFASTDAVTNASTLVNIAGDLRGIGIAARVPATNIAGIEMQGEHFIFQDPATGWPMRLSFYGQYEQVMLELQTIYGLQIMQADRLVRPYTYSS